jgi:hypothetical protein
LDIFKQPPQNMVFGQAEKFTITHDQSNMKEAGDEDHRP